MIGVGSYCCSSVETPAPSSTEDQAKDALNLQNQEKLCRDFCEKKGYVVEEVFVDRGESARSVDRPEFQRMLTFCKKNRNKVALVIVQDLSRFARNNADQSQTIKELERNNISLYSIYDGPIEKTAVGKLKANVVGSLNQFYSDSHSERQRERKRMAAEAGRMPGERGLAIKT